MIAETQPKKKKISIKQTKEILFTAIVYFIFSIE